MSSVLLALVIGTVGAALAGIAVGTIALRRTGIYFAMITVAVAEMFFFLENSPLSAWTGGENGLPGVPTPRFEFGSFSYEVGTGWSMYGFLAVCYFIGIVLALRIMRSPVGAIFNAIRDNPEVRAVGHQGACLQDDGSSSSRPPMRVLPAACSACCKASCRPRLSPSTPPASW